MAVIVVFFRVGLESVNQSRVAVAEARGQFGEPEEGEAVTGSVMKTLTDGPRERERERVCV
jgi:hypothetical protein